MSIPGYKIGVEHIREPYRTLVSELLKALLEVWRDNLVALVVFGSVARGDARRDSDIDLLIIGHCLPRSRVCIRLGGVQGHPGNPTS
jgi:predicted nucleotidyltransferase